MNNTELGRNELSAIEEKLSEIRQLISKCKTITGVSFMIDETGYDQHVAQAIEEGGSPDDAEYKEYKGRRILPRYLPSYQPRR